MASNTLGDGEDAFVFDENVWDDPEPDALIATAYGNHNDEGEVQAGRGEKRGSMKVTKSQKPKTNKDNITMSWIPKGNSIAKNLGWQASDTVYYSTTSLPTVISSKVIGPRIKLSVIC